MDTENIIIVDFANTGNAGSTPRVTGRGENRRTVLSGGKASAAATRWRGRGTKGAAVRKQIAADAKKTGMTGQKAYAAARKGGKKAKAPAPKSGAEKHTGKTKVGLKKQAEKATKTKRAKKLARKSK